MTKASKKKRSFWKEKLNKWQESSLSRKGFCEKNGLKRTVANYRFKKLLTLENEGGFVEIKPVFIEANREEGDKYKIEVTGTNFNAEVFSEVVEVLGNI